MTRAKFDHVAGCVGKVAFHSFGRAKRQARLSAQRHKLAYAAYPCPACHHFHVGTTLGGYGEQADTRKPYEVYAKNVHTGESTLVGFSCHADGRDLSLVIGEGWYITQVRKKQ